MPSAQLLQRGPKSVNTQIFSLSRRNKPKRTQLSPRLMSVSASCHLRGLLCSALLSLANFELRWEEFPHLLSLLKSPCTAQPHTPVSPWVQRRPWRAEMHLALSSAAMRSQSELRDSPGPCTSWNQSLALTAWQKGQGKDFKLFSTVVAAQVLKSGWDPG